MNFQGIPDTGHVGAGVEVLTAYKPDGRAGFLEHTDDQVFQLFCQGGFGIAVFEVHKNMLAGYRIQEGWLVRFCHLFDLISVWNRWFLWIRILRKSILYRDGCAVQKVVALFIDNALEPVFRNADDRELPLDSSTKAYGVVLNAQKLGGLLGARHQLYKARNTFAGTNGADPKECKCQDEIFHKALEV